jgi:hypothetical protein
MGSRATDVPSKAITGASPPQNQYETLMASPTQAMQIIGLHLPGCAIGRALVVHGRQRAHIKGARPPSGALSGELQELCLARCATFRKLSIGKLQS